MILALKSNMYLYEIFIISTKTFSEIDPDAWGPFLLTYINFYPGMDK